nr:hypothetical protein [Tanacetum cinerariifolium]
MGANKNMTQVANVNNVHTLNATTNVAVNMDTSSLDEKIYDMEVKGQQDSTNGLSSSYEAKLNPCMNSSLVGTIETSTKKVNFPVLKPTIPTMMMLILSSWVKEVNNRCANTFGSGYETKSLYERGKEMKDDDPYDYDPYDADDDVEYNSHNLSEDQSAVCDAWDIMIHGRKKS